MLGISTGVKSYITNQMNANVNPLLIEASKPNDSGKELELNIVDNGNIIKGKAKISGIYKSSNPMEYL